MKIYAAILALLLLSNLSSISFAAISPSNSNSPKIIRYPELPIYRQEIGDLIKQYGCGPGTQYPCPSYLSENTKEYIEQIKTYLLTRVGTCVQEIQLDKLDEIIRSAEENKRADVIKIIIEYLYATEHAPVLCLLAGEGYLASCDILLRHGDSINRRSILGKTALMCAAQNGQYNMTHFLLSKKPDIMLRSICDNNALELAFANHHPEIGLLIVQAQSQQLDSLNKIS